MSLIPIDQREVVPCHPGEIPVARRALEERLTYLEVELAAIRHRALEIALPEIAGRVDALRPIVRVLIADLRRCPR